MRTVILLGTPFFVSELRSLLATSSSIEMKDYDGASMLMAHYTFISESLKRIKQGSMKISHWQNLQKRHGLFRF